MKYQTEKHDHENILNSPKTDDKIYKKKYSSLNEKNVFMIVSEISIGSVIMGVGSGLTLSGLVPVGIFCASTISILSSISTLVTNEDFFKLKICSTKLRDRINVITLLYENTLKQSMVDKKLIKKKVRISQR